MQNKNGQTAKRALLVGAGEGAKLLVGELSRSPLPPFLPVCLADDDPMKRGLVLGGGPGARTAAPIPALCAPCPAGGLLLSLSFIVVFSAFPFPGFEGAKPLASRCV